MPTEPNYFRSRLNALTFNVAFHFFPKSWLKNWSYFFIDPVRSKPEPVQFPRTRLAVLRVTRLSVFVVMDRIIDLAFGFTTLNENLSYLL